MSPRILSGIVQVHPKPKPISHIDRGARKNKSVFAFPRVEEEKKKNRTRNEDVVERNSSPPATALLDPYARLRGRKYPQFSVISVEAAYPIGVVLVELIGRH